MATRNITLVVVPGTGARSISVDSNTNTGVELVWINDGDSSQWIQPFSVPGPLSPDAGYFTVTGGTVFQSGFTANTFYSSGQVGVGTSNPNVAAIIEIASTSQGVLFPRMTKVQRDAISSPPTGLILFVTDGDNEGLYIYKSTGWVQII